MTVSGLYKKNLPMIVQLSLGSKLEDKEHYI